MTDKILRADSTQIANIISCTFKESVNTEECLRFGSAVASSIEFSAYGTQSDAPAVGEVLTYYQTDGNGVDTLIGKFIATPSVPSKNSYTVVAYDSIILLEADFSEQLAAIQSSFPMTLNALLSEVATVAGVTFGNNPTLGSTSIAEFSASGVSCRQVVAWAAEMSGQYVYADTSGNVCFGWYSVVSGKKVYKQSGSSGGVTYVPYRQDGLDYKDFAVSAVDGVAVFPPEVEGAAAVYPSAATGNMYNVRDNLLLSGASVATLDTVAQTLYTVLSALTAYRPCSIQLFRFDNPFRAGDIIAVEDAQGVSFNTLVMSMTVNMDGATVECTGRETYDGDYGKSYRDELVNLASNIVRIDKLKVDWADINTAIINYLTANDVTAQNVTIVDASSNVIATFNDTGITLYNNGVAVATYNSNSVILGDANNVHAEIDYNSFELYDKNSRLYCSIGNTRDANGFENITLNYTGDGSTTAYLFHPMCSHNELPTVRVKVNGTLVNNYSAYTVGLSFTTAPAVGDSIEITYKTTIGLYHYDLGQRSSGTNIGSSSLVAGTESEASGTCSSVLGGRQNVASGEDSAVCGGYNSTASGSQSVSGGRGNTASGEFSVAFGGGGNVASGRSSVVPGGQHNEANHRSQMVFGEYNDKDPSTAASTARGNYVEIVGNGTADNARSNARTLDWSGNEVLAGGLTINGTKAVGALETSATPADLGTAAVGTSNNAARADHVHNLPSIPAAATALPQPLGTAAVGNSTKYARENHVHKMPSASDVGALPTGTTPADIGAISDTDAAHRMVVREGGTGTLSVTITSGTNRGLLFVSSGTAARNGLYIVHGGSTGTISCVPVLSSSVLTFDTATTGVLKITNSSAVYMYIIWLGASGNSNVTVS